jgi:DNA adenine methylase
MKSSEVLIKWIGTKRLQSTQIIKYFPQTINCYYEVFLGGGAMLFTLLSSKINVKKIVCVDLNTSLIGIYQLVITDPNKLYESYLTHWNNLDTEGKYYYQLRQEFNNDKDPLKFFFLLRTCRNGLVRYNKQGNFNSAFHFKRHGVMPEKLKQTINLWHEKLRNQDITFANGRYG